MIPAYMVRITINSQPVEWTKLSYHFQITPKPGGATYSIEVGYEESFIIAHIEDMVGKRVNDSEFECAAMGHWATTYNLVEYVLRKMEESIDKKTDRPLWVLNNIGNVVAMKTGLTITGACSPFVVNFGK